MAATVVASDKGSAASTIAETPAFAVSGSNRVLYACLVGVSTGAMTHNDVRWQGAGGTSLTKLGSTYTIGSYLTVSLWRIIAPTAATDTVIGEVTGAIYTMIIGVSVQDADQTTPNGTVANANGTSTSPSVNASSASGQLVLDFMSWSDIAGAARTATVGAGQTSLQEIEGAAISYGGECSSRETAGGASTTMSWSISNSISDWLSLAFSINDASSGSTHDVSVSESASAAVAYSAAISFASVIAESASVAAAKASNLLLSSSVSEAAAANAAFDVLHTLLAQVNAGASAAEAMTAVLAAQNSASESASAAVAVSASLDSLSLVIEAVSAAMTVDSTALTVVNADVAEGAAAAVAVTAILSAFAAVAEAGTSATGLQSLWIGTDSIVEAGSTAITITASATMQVALPATAAAVFAAVAEIVQISDVLEGVSAGAAMVANLAALAQLVESGAADADLIAQLAALALVIEAGAAGSLVASSVIGGGSHSGGRLLTVRAGTRVLNVRVNTRRTTVH